MHSLTAVSEEKESKPDRLQMKRRMPRPLARLSLAGLLTISLTVLALSLLEPRQAQRIGLGMLMLQILLVASVVAVVIRRSAAQKLQLVENEAQLVDQAIEIDDQAGQLIEQAVQLGERSGETENTLAQLAASNKDLAFNITELRLAKASVAKASASNSEIQSLLDAFLGSSPVGFGVVDEGLCYTVVNESMASMFGVSAADLAGKRPRDVAPADLAREIEHLMREVIRTRKPIENVEQLRFNPLNLDEECYWLVGYFPVGQKSGEVHGVGVVALETTANKRLKQQLVEAQKLEAVGRLAGGVAHDFNNMLTAIKSYSELVLDDLEPGTIPHADVGEIKKAADRAIVLTRHLLAFCSQQVMRPKLMDLNVTVAGIEGMLRPLVGASIRVDTVLAGQVKPVIADRAEIERVIMNLVINSRDAMPDGGTLTVETSNVCLTKPYNVGRSTAPPGEYVTMSVTDTGIGMTKEVRERMFEPFFSTKERGKGTGLGLSSAFGAIKRLNGHIHCESQVGHGTTFRIYLPIADDSSASQEPYPCDVVPCENLFNVKASRGRLARSQA